MTNLGYVESPSEFYQNVDVICAPYSVGGGVRIKVLESYCYGKPVVGFPLAFRGLPSIAATVGVVRETPSELTEALLDLVDDSEKAIQAGALGRQIVLDVHSAEKTRTRTVEFLNQLIGLSTHQLMQNSSECRVTSLH